MARSYRKKKKKEFTTVLGTTTRLFGKLNFTEALKIDGYFEGEIESTGVLFVEEGAHVVADIKAYTVVIAGHVEGNVIAKEKVEMLETCKLVGNVKTRKLRISDGVSFEGKCEMLRNADSLDIFSAPGEQLKQSVQGV